MWHICSCYKLLEVFFVLWNLVYLPCVVVTNWIGRESGFGEGGEERVRKRTPLEDAKLRINWWRFQFFPKHMESFQNWLPFLFLKNRSCLKYITEIVRTRKIIFNIKTKCKDDSKTIYFQRWHLMVTYMRTCFGNINHWYGIA